MNRIIVMLGLVWVALPGAAQTKPDTSTVKNLTPEISNNLKNVSMKDYVFILWLKPLTPDVLAQVAPKWTVLIPKWISEGHFIGNATMVNEGTLISGKDRIISNKPINNKGEIVLDVLHMKAKNMDQALELAKQVPTLDVGGAVEVREGLPLPGSPNN